MLGLIIFVMFGIAVLFVKEKYLVPTIVIFLIVIFCMIAIHKFDDKINADHPTSESTYARKK